MPSLAENDAVLVVEQLDSEGGVVNRRRLEDDEQEPLLNGGEGRSSFEAEDPPKSPSFEYLKWYQRPSVSLGFNFSKNVRSPKL
jgi:hypothetical protein